MKTRLIAGVIAVVLAVVGSVLLVSYVRGADSRAMAGLETVDVLVAAQPIAEGTSAADLATLVEARQLPRNTVLPGGVTDLDQLAGQVALVPLSAGEQLLDSKFGEPATSVSTEPVVPPEMQEVTVLLDRQRALGGRIAAGDTVGVFLSVKDPERTHLTAHKVLVTHVEFTAPATTNSDETDSTSDEAAEPAPTDLTESLLVTVAATAPVAEKIVFAATYGSIWLSDEPLSADENGTQIMDGTVVYQ